TYAAWAQHAPVTVGWVTGEHPQFLALRDDVPVVVRFSPPRGEPAGDRVADRLVAEHLALTTLAEAGHPAAPTRLLEADGRVFLEVERFDRTRHGGRRGFVTLRALHHEHVEDEPTRPSATSGRLLDLRVIDETTHRKVRFREQFATWAGHPDLPLTDVALFLDRLVPRGLAPATTLRPAVGTDGEQPLRRAGSPNGDISRPAHEAAMAFWERVAHDARISAATRALAGQTRSRLAGVAPL
ncbi:MAG: hypothetical protein AAF602_19060, partial [Myxococcota bacterium]